VSDPNPAAAPAQFRSLLRAFALDPGPLTDHVLTADHLARTIAEEAGPTRDRVVTPPVTVAAFLGQVLSDDHSCQAAVDRLIAWRAMAASMAATVRTQRGPRHPTQSGTGMTASQTGGSP
jgi:hypothetical protein